MTAERGGHEQAAILLGVAQRVRDSSSLTLIDLDLRQHELSMSVIVRGIGQKTFDVAYARGRAMTVEDGVAFAVDGVTRPKQAPASRAETEQHTVLTGRQREIARLVADDLSNR